MTHCREGLLRTFTDGALPTAARARVAAHLAACPACRATLAEVRSVTAWAASRLVPEPAAAGSGAAAEAIGRRLQAVWSERGAAPGRAAMPRARSLLGPSVAAGAAALCAAALILSPVRAIAGGFLQLFRPQHFQVVNVSQADLRAIRTALQGSGAAVDVPGLVRISVGANPGPRSVALGQASGDVGFPVLTVSDPPGGAALQGVRVQPGLDVGFSRLNVPALQQLLLSLGSTQRLPGGLGGASAQLQLQPAVLLSYGGPGAAESFQVLETGAPSLAVSTAGVSVEAVRNLLLGLSFLPASLRAQLAAVGDWQNTVPVPDVPGISQPVSVRGAPGVFLELGGGGLRGGRQSARGTRGTAPGAQAALLWMRGQVLCGVEGTLTEGQALALAQKVG
jgi:anti-sigma factor RsiW